MTRVPQKARPASMLFKKLSTKQGQNMYTRTIHIQMTNKAVQYTVNTKQHWVKKESAWGQYRIPYVG